MSALDDLAASVAANKSVTDSAVLLIQGVSAQLSQLAAELAQNGIDDARVLALKAELDAGTQGLADAVAANTTP